MATKKICKEIGGLKQFKEEMIREFRVTFSGFASQIKLVAEDVVIVNEKLDRL